MKKVKLLDTLDVLYGWEDFLRANGIRHHDPLRTFGAYVTGAEDSRRSARTVVLDALRHAGEDACRTCRIYEIPLWPAVIPPSGFNFQPSAF